MLRNHKKQSLDTALSELEKEMDAKQNSESAQLKTWDKG